MKSVPLWREAGTKARAEHEEKRYSCPECAARIFRGAQQCNTGKRDVDPD